MGKGRTRSGSVSSHRDDRLERHSSQHVDDGDDGGLSNHVNSNSSNMARGTPKLGMDLFNLQGIELDESRLFLLQTAFRSLGNFFSLATNTNPSTAAGSAKGLYQQFSSNQQQQQQQQQQQSQDIMQAFGSSFSLGFPGFGGARSTGGRVLGCSYVSCYVIIH